MNKPQKITLNILLCVILLYCLYCMKNTVILLFKGQREFDTYAQKCGKVVNKIQPTSLEAHKYSANVTVEEFLYVNYNGYIEKERVNSNTWYKYNVGDLLKVRFDLSADIIYLDEKTEDFVFDGYITNKEDLEQIQKLLRLP